MSERTSDPLLGRLREAISSETQTTPDSDQQLDSRAQQLLNRLDKDLLTAAASRRSTRVSRPRRIIRPRYAVGGSLVAGVAVLVFIVTGGSSPTVSSAATFLSAAAKTALAQPNVPLLAPGQYYYEPTIDSYSEACQDYTTPAGLSELAGADGTGPVLVYDSQLARDEWSAQNNGGAIQTTSVGGHFATTADKTAWVSEGSPSVAGCAAPATSGLQDLPAPTSGGGGVGYLPTSAAALGALLAEGRVNDEGQVSASDVYCPTTSTNDSASDGDACSVATQFDIASNLLVQPEGPSLVGPALYSVLAQLPGVEEIGTLTDAYGRTGTAIEDPNSGTVFVIDPSNGQLLEQESLAIGTSVSSAFPAGSVRFSVAYGSLSVVNSLGARPTGDTQASS
jgi:hypothetical protein